MPTTGKDILNIIREQSDLSDYRKVHWEGSFEEYMEIVRENPEVTRSAYQRLYDMILSHGVDERQENKEKTIRYRFFTEFGDKHADAVYGLDRILMQLVNAFMSAAHEYGTERRVLLLHGPVGSSKSTIARLLKRGLEEYSRTDEGMLFSFAWNGPEETWLKDPMHGDPLQLVPPNMRDAVIHRFNETCTKKPRYPIQIKGDLSPYSRFMFNDRLKKYNGDI
ncbi:MAG: serine protein kinase, partial [Planctomycetes bacterium]|nr:serine protein kinase [Planctomycetota bacterium]